MTGIPAPTLERFEKTGKISLESFCKIVVELGYFNEMSVILSKTEIHHRRRTRNHKQKQKTAERTIILSLICRDSL